MRTSLKPAVDLLDAAIRRLEFGPAVIKIPDGEMRLSHPVDATGVEDLNYLVVQFPSKLPKMRIHRTLQILGPYVAELESGQFSESEIIATAISIERMCAVSTAPKFFSILRLVLLVIQPLIYVCFIIAHLKTHRNITRISERFGIGRIKQQKKRTIWLHASSLGEVKQFSATIDRLLETSDANILVTTHTLSSGNWVSSAYPTVIHQFAPFDIKICLQTFLRKWTPDVLVIAENDLWPEMITIAQKFGVGLIQMGARPSRTRRRYPMLVGYLQKCFSLITCATNEVRNELISVGVDPRRIILCPDPRKFNPKLQVDELLVKQITTQLSNRWAWLAASTHPSDIDVVLDAHLKLQSPDRSVLLIAPRHPSDSSAIKSGCRRRGLQASQRSTVEPITDDTDVYIFDTFGELGTLFSLCSSVFMGGGIGSEGGHNPYEPASFGCSIITGPLVNNYRHAYDAAFSSGSVQYVQTSQDLVKALKKIRWAGFRSDSFLCTSENFTGEHDTFDDIVFSFIAASLNSDKHMVGF